VGVCVLGGGCSGGRKRKHFLPEKSMGEDGRTWKNMDDDAVHNNLSDNVLDCLTVRCSEQTNMGRGVQAARPAVC